MLADTGVAERGYHAWALCHPVLLRREQDEQTASQPPPPARRWLLTVGCAGSPLRLLPAGVRTHRDEKHIAGVDAVSHVGVRLDDQDVVEARAPQSSRDAPQRVPGLNHVPDDPSATCRGSELPQLLPQTVLRRPQLIPLAGYLPELVFQGHDVGSRRLRILDIAPATKVLLATDGYDQPELFWFGAHVVREAWRHASAALRSSGARRSWLEEVERMIFERNARSLYRL